MGIIAPPAAPGNKLAINKYGARIARAVNTLFKPSAAFDTQVQLEVTCKASTATKIDIIVDGVKITGLVVPVGVTTVTEVPFCFIVPAGKEWKVETNAGIQEMFSNYLE